MAIVVNYRSEKAHKLQSILTKYGCLIKVRLGLHETADVCSEDGLIVLQLSGEKVEIQNLQSELNSIEGITANNMEVCSQHK
jgi:metal-responsive CopG/Arc/MetJ family transcriptional regulator